MMMTHMPAGIIVVEVGIEPRVVPYMTIELPSIIVVAPVMSPIHAVMVHPRIAPRAPTEGIARHVIPIVPVARGGEHVGIHAVIIDVPLPAGPQGTAIYHIPVERTAHGDGIARIAETDDAHGILIVRVAAIEAVYPSLLIRHASEAQGITGRPHRIALLGDEHKALIILGHSGHCTAILSQVRPTTVVGILVHRKAGSRYGGLCLLLHRCLLRLALRTGDSLSLHLRLFLLGNKVQVIALCRCRTYDSHQHQDYPYCSFHTFIYYTGSTLNFHDTKI